MHNATQLGTIVSGESRKRRSLISMIALSIVAIAITTYLASVSVTSSRVAGCGGGSIFDCDDVINSRWSRWLGVPVSLLAFGLYVSLLGISVWALARNRRATDRSSVVWSAIVVLAFLAGLASIWFVSLQVFVLKHLCSWCLAAHGCGVIATAVVLWQRPLPATALARLSLISAVGLGVLVGGQMMFKPVTFKVIEHESAPGSAASEPELFDFTPSAGESAPSREQSEPSQGANRSYDHLNDLNCAALAMIYPTSLFHHQLEQGSANSAETNSHRLRRFVTLSGGAIKLDVAQWPLLGKPDAKYMLVEMFDYTCDHCRRTHRAIEGAKERLGDDLAVVMLAVPLNTNCNSAIQVTGPRMAEACEIAKLAISVWRIDAKKFDPFHSYLMITPTTPSYAAAKAKAVKLLMEQKPDGRESAVATLEAELAKPTASQYIAQHVEIYKRVGAGNLPKLLFPKSTIVGEITSPESLLTIIHDQQPRAVPER